MGAFFFTQSPWTTSSSSRYGSSPENVGQLRRTDLMGKSQRVRYFALSTQDDILDRPLPSRSPDEQDLRYRFELHEEIPWGSIALALFLLAVGCIFLLTSHFIFIEHMGGDPSQAYGFLILGILLFLPGFYETRIAYYSWRGYKGFTFSGIPVR